MPTQRNGGRNVLAVKSATRNSTFYQIVLENDEKVHLTGLLNKHNEEEMAQKEGQKVTE